MGEKREGQRKKEERVCVPEENQVGVLGPIVYSFVFQRLNEQDISKKEKKKKKKKKKIALPKSRSNEFHGILGISKILLLIEKGNMRKHVLSIAILCHDTLCALPVLTETLNISEEDLIMVGNREQNPYPKPHKSGKLPKIVEIPYCLSFFPRS